MPAVLIGGLIVIWLGLSGGRALLAGLGVRLHRPVDALAPLLVALIETPLFLLAVPAGELLPEPQRWPAAIALTVLAWLVSGAAAALLWRREPRS